MPQPSKGIGFGWFADRFGRVRALTSSVLVYAAATGMCGLTYTAGQFMACRAVLGLGMGGEWASGAVLVAETWPARHRGKALAFVQSSWAVGPLVGFFGTGYFSGFSVIASELLPASLRGSAMGFAYNMGRIDSAAAPYLIGSVSQHQGVSYALCITSAAFLLAPLIATALRQSPAISSA